MPLSIPRLSTLNHRLRIPLRPSQTRRMECNLGTETDSYHQMASRQWTYPAITAINGVIVTKLSLLLLESGKTPRNPRNIMTIGFMDLHLAPRTILKAANLAVARINADQTILPNVTMILAVEPYKSQDELMKRALSLVNRKDRYYVPGLIGEGPESILQP